MMSLDLAPQGLVAAVLQRLPAEDGARERNLISSSAPALDFSQWTPRSAGAATDTT